MVSEKYKKYLQSTRGQLYLESQKKYIDRLSKSSDPKQRAMASSLSAERDALVRAFGGSNSSPVVVVKERTYELDGQKVSKELYDKYQKYKKGAKVSRKDGKNVHSINGVPVSKAVYDKFMNEGKVSASVQVKSFASGKNNEEKVLSSERLDVIQSSQVKSKKSFISLFTPIMSGASSDYELMNRSKKSQGFFSTLKEGFDLATSWIPNKKAEVNNPILVEQLKKGENAQRRGEAGFNYPDLVFAGTIGTTMSSANFESINANYDKTIKALNKNIVGKTVKSVATGRVIGESARKTTEFLATDISLTKEQKKIKEDLSIAEQNKIMQKGFEAQDRFIAGLEDPKLKETGNYTYKTAPEGYEYTEVPDGWERVSTNVIRKKETQLVNEKGTFKIPFTNKYLGYKSILNEMPFFGNIYAKGEFEKAVREELKKKGYTGQKLDEAVSLFSKQKNSAFAGELVGGLAVEATGEGVGRQGVKQFFGRSKDPIPKDKAFGTLFWGSAKELFPAGFGEGFNAELVQQASRRKETDVKTALIMGGAGGISASGIGGTIIGLSPVKPKTSKVLNIATYGLDPYEFMGDKTIDVLEKGLRKAGIDLGSPRILMPKSPTISLSVAPTSTKTQSKTKKSGVISFVVSPSITPSPTSILSPTKTTSITPTPIDTVTSIFSFTPVPNRDGIPSLAPTFTPVPSETPVQTPTLTNTFTPTPVPISTPLFKGSLPLLPTFDMFGGGGSKKETKKGKTYINELVMFRQNIFSGLNFGVQPMKKGVSGKQGMSFNPFGVQPVITNKSNKKDRRNNGLLRDVRFF